jgi:SHS family lactate transporter-like MFS transporter
MDQVQDSCEEILAIVLLFGWSNFLALASQDMYPNVLHVQLGFSPNAQAVFIAVTNLGGVLGCLVVGVFMEVLGRHLSIFIYCIIGGCFTYPAFMQNTTSAFGLWNLLL